MHFEHNTQAPYYENDNLSAQHDDDDPVVTSKDLPKLNTTKQLFIVTEVQLRTVVDYFIFVCFNF